MKEEQMDIVERLRELAHPMTGLARGFDDAQAWLNEAADEIERLRQECESGLRCQSKLISGFSRPTDVELRNLIGPVRVPVGVWAKKKRRRWWQGRAKR